MAFKMRVCKAFRHIEHSLKLHLGGGAVIASPALTSLTENRLGLFADPKAWVESQYNEVYRQKEEGLLLHSQWQEGH
jgi:hypothetical protein